MRRHLNESALEIITVRIKGKRSGRYEGFGGTFSSMVDSCLRKKSLPGFYEGGLVRSAELKANTLFVYLAGERVESAATEIMDIALRNIGAFPSREMGKEGFFIDVMEPL